jgi:hypothetical protein
MWSYKRALYICEEDKKIYSSHCQEVQIALNHNHNVRDFIHFNLVCIRYHIQVYLPTSFSHTYIRSTLINPWKLVIFDRLLFNRADIFHDPFHTVLKRCSTLIIESSKLQVLLGLVWTSTPVATRKLNKSLATKFP